MADMRQYGTTYRFTLEPYRGPSTRHTCPSCGKHKTFTRYVDVTTGDALGDDVGRCNREINCGYHKPPRAAMLNDMSLIVDINKVKPVFTKAEIPNTIDAKYVNKHWDFDDNLSKFLFKHFDIKDVYKILSRYKIGTGHNWPGSTIFWQIDFNYDVRTGKVMLYNESTGKRVKEPFPHINWVHSPMRNNEYGDLNDFCLRQCYFGEHLLNEFSGTVRIVESEKTALICSLKRPEQLWVATGGLSNINPWKLEPFIGRELIFYPDKGLAAAKWESKVDGLGRGYNARVDKTINNMSILDEGDDLADLIIKKLIK